MRDVPAPVMMMIFLLSMLTIYQNLTIVGDLLM